MIILVTMLGLSGLWYEIAKRTDARGIIARPLDDPSDHTQYLKPHPSSEDPIRDLGWAFAVIMVVLYFCR